MTNLQRFAELFKNEEGIDQLILDNFNDQDNSTYTLNGVTYLLFNEDEVQEKLDEDFDDEVSELVEQIEYDYPRLSSVIYNVIDNRYNYKECRHDYSSLKNYNFICTDNEIYIYTLN